MTNDKEMVRLGLKILGRARFKDSVCNYRWASAALHGLTLAAINTGNDSMDLIDITICCNRLKEEEY